jgi:hypothetical protein
MQQAVPPVLLTPDAAVLERAVRERPDVAAAVLEQLRYRAKDKPALGTNPLDGPAVVADGASGGGRVHADAVDPDAVHSTAVHPDGGGGDDPAEHVRADRR